MSPMGLMSPIGRKNRAWELAVVRFLAQSIESIESIESIIVHRVHRLAVKTKHENDGKYEKYVLGQGCPKYKARKARKVGKAIVQNGFAVAAVRFGRGIPEPMRIGKFFENYYAQLSKMVPFVAETHKPHRPHVQNERGGCPKWFCCSAVRIGRLDRNHPLRERALHQRSSQCGGPE